MIEQGPPEQLRLDLWLDVACIYRNRSAAQRACRGGKISVNGTRAKPHREVRAGDHIAVTTPRGLKRLLIVTALTEQHIPKADARSLYHDVTPPPTQSEIEVRDLLRHAGPAPGTRQGSPSRNTRRLRRGVKERIYWQDSG